MKGQITRRTETASILSKIEDKRARDVWIYTSSTTPAHLNITNKDAITLSTNIKLSLIKCVLVKPEIPAAFGSSRWVYLSKTSSAFVLKSATALVAHWRNPHFRLSSRHNKSHAVRISTFLFRISWRLSCAVRHTAQQYCFWEFSTYYISHVQRNKTGSYLLIVSSSWKKKKNHLNTYSRQ